MTGDRPGDNFVLATALSSDTSPEGSSVKKGEGRSTALRRRQRVERPSVQQLDRARVPYPHPGVYECRRRTLTARRPSPAQSWCRHLQGTGIQALPRCCLKRRRAPKESPGEPDSRREE